MTDRLPLQEWDCAILGGGPAGLSAAIYLGRSRRRTVVLDAGHSMAKWEERAENYLGFPDGVSGQSLLQHGRRQARRFGAALLEDDVRTIRRHEAGGFELEGDGRYRSRRVLLATGLTHLLPDILGAKDCLGKSVFFCKDCDAFRVQGRRIAIIGARNEAARYALSMLAFSPSVLIATSGEPPAWDECWQRWLEEYGIEIRREPIAALRHHHGVVHGVRFRTGSDCEVEAVFATRGDLFHTALAEPLGAQEDGEGQLVVDADMKTTVPGLYAAGCVTPANCQMIIAAGQGATAGQAINRDLFDDDLAAHALRVCAAAVPTRGGVPV
jgi:thioredoxin reductase (NADPH)